MVPPRRARPSRSAWRRPGGGSRARRASGPCPTGSGSTDSPAGHHRVDEVGVTGVVVGGVPVGPLAEAAQVGGQHHITPADQLERRSRRWGPRSSRGRTTSDLPGPWPWQASTAGPGSTGRRGPAGRPAPTWCPRCRRRSSPAGTRAADGLEALDVEAAPGPAPGRAARPGGPGSGPSTPQARRDRSRRGDRAGRSPSGGSPTGTTASNSAGAGSSRPCPRCLHSGSRPIARYRARLGVPVPNGPSVEGGPGRAQWPVTLAAELDVHPISPLIGAEISGLDLAVPLGRGGHGGRPRRPQHPPRDLLPATRPRPPAQQADFAAPIR